MPFHPHLDRKHHTMVNGVIVGWYLREMIWQSRKPDSPGGKQEARGNGGQVLSFIIALSKKLTRVP